MPRDSLDDLDDDAFDEPSAVDAPPKSFAPPAVINWVMRRIIDGLRFLMSDRAVYWSAMTLRRRASPSLGREDAPDDDVVGVEPPGEARRMPSPARGPKEGARVGKASETSSSVSGMGSIAARAPTSAGRQERNGLLRNNFADGLRRQAERMPLR